ncbi:type 2 DNA topoisomerase 6 subunit B-like isoform X2 [Gadus morhua]|uniref:type 2 DNA topoisomerase 6 subunit B-like isoform X2 n=1 Tax=Gadus morhua TaxID=8049 RepID=UPI0011B5FE9E|nr:type 2 DNA topoisomerase 6 subunit B-like isoform X2 [Gadus morhua]
MGWPFGDDRAAMRILNEIQRVMRLIMLLRRQRGCKGLKSGEGGLMVVLWNSKESYRVDHCRPLLDVSGAPMGTDLVFGSIAAAGPWCEGFATGNLKPGFTDLIQKLFPSEDQGPEPDQEELCGFTHMHGPIHLLISFQVKVAKQFDRQEWPFHIEAFLHKLSLTNARVKIHFSCKSYQKRLQRIFSGKIQCKLTLKDQWSTFLDVTSSKPGVSVGERPWCHGGHPVPGERVSLSIPPAAMERGLYGELSLQPVALLAPCVLQYPNLATRLTHIQVEVYGPSNVPVASPTDFLQQLSVHLNCEELGIDGILRWNDPTDLQPRGGATLPVEAETGPEGGRSLASVEQSLTLLLFLHHMDPFTSELYDVIEELLEHHLEAILTNNRQAVTAALQREIKSILNAHRRRSKASERICSAFEVISSSALSIVSSSSNLDFRAACLSNMRVRDTHGLSQALREAQVRVTSWKFVPKARCYPVPQEDTPTRTEM